MAHVKPNPCVRKHCSALQCGLRVPVHVSNDKKERKNRGSDTQSLQKHSLLHRIQHTEKRQILGESAQAMSQTSHMDAFLSVPECFLQRGNEHERQLTISRMYEVELLLSCDCYQHVARQIAGIWIVLELADNFSHLDAAHRRCYRIHNCVGAERSQEKLGCGVLFACNEASLKLRELTGSYGCSTKHMNQSIRQKQHTLGANSLKLRDSKLPSTQMQKLFRWCCFSRTNQEF